MLLEHEPRLRIWVSKTGCYDWKVDESECHRQGDRSSASRSRKNSNGNYCLWFGEQSEQHLCKHWPNSPFSIILDDFFLFIRSNRKIQSIISGTRTKLITMWTWMLFTANQIANVLRSLLKHQKAKILNRISCFSNQNQPNQKFSHCKWSLE